MFLLKIIFKTLFKSAKIILIPSVLGLFSFFLFHEVVDKYLYIRIPFLSKTLLSDSVNNFGQYLIGAHEMTETKLMFLYFILSWIIILIISSHISPFVGCAAWGILFCIIQYILIKYYVSEEWQCTIFAKFGIVIERVLSFEDIRIIMENLCLTHYCIEPGMNPCKMARDCINGHELEGKLLQEMIEHIWATTEDYDSWAGLAGEYVDKIGPRQTKFTHWYYWYDVWPDPRLQPPEYHQNLYNEDTFWWDMFYVGLGTAVGYGLMEIISTIYC